MIDYVACTYHSMLGVDVMCKQHLLGISVINKKLHFLNPLSITGKVDGCTMLLESTIIHAGVSC